MARDITGTKEKDKLQALQPRTRLCQVARPLAQSTEILRLPDPADPIVQLSFYFDQASEKTCTAPVRSIFWQLFGTAGHRPEMEPKTVGHRAVVFAHRTADRAD